MQLKCPNCGETIPARQINVEKLVAICPHCDAVFSVDASAVASVNSGRKRRKVAKPEKFQVVENHNNLQITYSARKNPDWFEALLTVIFSAISLAGIAGTGVLLTQGLLLPALLLIALVLLMIYLTATIVVNQNEIRMDEDSLTFTTGPLPVLSNKRFELHDVMRVYAKSAGLSGSPSDDYYHVMVELRDGSDKVLVDFVQRRQADYIIQMLEEYLKQDVGAHDNPFVEAGESTDTTGNIPGSALADGEITTGEADEDVPVTLDDLLRDEQRKNQHRDS